MKTIKTIFRWLGDIVLCMLVITAVFSVFSFVQSKRNSNYIPGIGPYKFMAVLSGSMSPTFNVYDMIVDKTVNPNDLRIGDVITMSEGNALVTHRIVKIEEKDGKKYFITRGDANNVEDQSLVTIEQVQAKYLFRIPYIGLILSKIRGPIGIGIVWAVFIFFAMAEIIPEILKVKKKDAEATKENKDGIEAVKSDNIVS